VGQSNCHSRKRLVQRRIPIFAPLRLRRSSPHRQGGVIEAILSGQPELFLEALRRKIDVDANGTVIGNDPEDAAGLLARVTVGVDFRLRGIDLGGVAVRGGPTVACRCCTCARPAAIPVNSRIIVQKLGYVSKLHPQLSLSGIEPYPPGCRLFPAWPTVTFDSREVFEDAPPNLFSSWRFDASCSHAPLETCLSY
jgi:hypothetical protein